MNCYSRQNMPMRYSSKYFASLVITIATLIAAFPTRADDRPMTTFLQTTVEEDALADGPITVNGNLPVDFGNDGPGTILPTGVVQASSFGIFGQTDKLRSDGVEITFSQTANGYIGTADGTEVVTFEIDSSSGDFTITLNEKVDHYLNNFSSDISFISFGVIAEDADGDSVKTTVRLNIKESTTISNDGNLRVSWNDGDANYHKWWLYLGSKPNARDYFDSGELQATDTTILASNLPTDGTKVYAKLWYMLEGEAVWRFFEREYDAFGSMPAFTSPLSGDQLEGADATFTWADNGAGADQYWVEIGSSVGAKDYLNSGTLTGTNTLTVTGLPDDGTSTVFVRLWYRSNGGTWLFIDDTFTAGTGSATLPAIVSPTAPGPLTDPAGTETFNWSTAGSGSDYWLYAGSTQGGKQYHDSGNLGDTTTYNVTNLPTNASEVWIRLWYRVGAVGNWRYIDEVFTANGSGPTISTSSGTDVVTGPADTFTWSDPNGTVTAWWLYIGSIAGGSDYENSGNLNTATTYTTQQNNLPTISGEAVYVRLWYKQGSEDWLYIDRLFYSSSDQ